MLCEVHYTLYFPHCNVCQVIERNFLEKIQLISVILTPVCSTYDILGGGAGGSKNLFSCPVSMFSDIVQHTQFEAYCIQEPYLLFLGPIFWTKNL